jgi:protein involved in polysaccharide export with SLBB domain
VTVLRQPDFELQRMVRVAGEVVFPGPFALQKRDERLSSLVRRAGGLAATAFIEGARLMRVADSAGPVNINLAAALRQPGGTADLILRPGDVLEVPEYNAVVKVQGAVVAPMSVQYRPGASLAYYIGNAGGYARNADKGRVSVRYANGSAEVTTRTLLLFRNRPEVRPGATVSVPVKPEGEPFNVTGFLSAAAQILASTVAIIVVATR